jgi:uncharacterized protein YndB with AHSA1/START domain
MSVKKEPSGRRSVQVEVEVPGTPEQVWEAIATGPGVSSWFVPTEIREDGTVVAHMGPGMDAVAKQTAWEPPHRFAAVSQDLGPEAPALATEWIVEARSGDTCVVRVVHSLFASSDDWDNQLESFESGWPGFFAVLRLYLERFRGERCSSFRMMGAAKGAEAEADGWARLTGTLGFAGATAGERLKTKAGAPPVAGTVVRTGDGKHPHGLVLRTDDPAPGIASIKADAICGQVFVMAWFYFYGETAKDAAARAEPLWQAWMNRNFPFPA